MHVPAAAPETPETFKNYLSPLLCCSFDSTCCFRFLSLADRTKSYVSNIKKCVGPLAVSCIVMVSSSDVFIILVGGKGYV